MSSMALRWVGRPAQDQRTLVIMKDINCLLSARSPAVKQKLCWMLYVTEHSRVNYSKLPRTPHRIRQVTGRPSDKFTTTFKHMANTFFMRPIDQEKIKKSSIICVNYLRSHIFHMQPLHPTKTQALVGVKAPSDTILNPSNPPAPAPSQLNVG